jgi:hypothetical protein
MSIDNTLRIQLVSGYEPELERAEAISFSTFYPGGLFGTLSFLVRRDVTRSWSLCGHQMIRVTNGPETVWEGETVAPAYIPGLGFRVDCLGYWAGILEARKWRKPWADKRLGEEAWVEVATNYEAAWVDRQNRIHITPRTMRDAAGNDVAWALNQIHGVRYTAPTGETVKRIAGSFDLQEGAQQWQIEIRTSDGTQWSRNTSGTGAFDVTLATARQVVELYLRSLASQTPPTDGTVYGEFSNLTVYTETGAIDLTEIAKDIAAHESDLSTSLGQIASNTYALVPFVSEDERLADCLMRAAGYGDGSGNAWAVSVVESALGADGKPVLRVAQQPSLTASDYLLRLDEPNVQPGVVFRQDIAAVRNWIAVKYRDANGRAVYLTPDDDAALKDDSSITDYGERQAWLDVPTSSATTAKAFGVRYLAQYKDPRWQASGGITVKGYIRTVSGGLLPACRIRAGMRVRVENYLNDLSGTGLTLLISGTRYQAERETCTLSVGVPDFLAVQMARMAGR